MTPSKLKSEVEKNNPKSLFFSRNNMKFAGDTMSNFGVRSAEIKTNWDINGKWSDTDGIIVECWELYRKRPVKNGLQSSHYFSKADFSKVSKAI